jgi:hypothetical protein
VTHPFTDTARRSIAGCLLTVVIATAHTLIERYAGLTWPAAVIDGGLSVGLLAVLGYFAWYILRYLPIPGIDYIAGGAALGMWTAGCLLGWHINMQLTGTPDCFLPMLPFRLLFALPAWCALTLWYRLQMTLEARDNLPLPDNGPTERPAEPILDRITVRDGARIHIVRVTDLLCIRSCGDYVALVTHEGEFIKELTMKYLDEHLPRETFVRIHRSAIVNVTQVSRIELFGRDTYQLHLKNGLKLRMSLAGYQLLRRRLDL